MTRFARLPILFAGLMLVGARLQAAGSLYCNTKVYAPFNIAWNARMDLRQVRGIFPHPVLAQTTVLATDAGLMLTMDAGSSWKSLPEASVDRIGRINDVAFDPAAPGTFYAGSDSKGIWVTTDNGGTFSQVGAKSGGMASDSVVSLIVYPGDPSRQTLMAVHGGAAPGISRSRNGGKTWDILNADYAFRRVMGGGANSQQLFLFGSASKEPDIQSCYACISAGEFPVEAVRDVVPTDMVCAPVRERGGDVIYISTSDSGLYRVSGDDSSPISHNVKKLTVNNVDDWASVAVVWGANADTMRVFAYNPATLGLVASTDDFVTSHPVGSGLLVSPLVKEGSRIRSNANGTVFYAVINNLLSVGRVTGGVPVVDLAPPVLKLRGNENVMFDYLRDEFTQFSRATGSTVAAARVLSGNVGDLKKPYLNCQLAITASLPLKPVPPISVTVDLSRLGGLAETPLYDDGQHGDGAAGDGVYGVAFAFLPAAHQTAEGDWRASWPGRIALGVTATYADGHNEGAVGILGVYPLLKDYDIWNHDGGDISAGCKGEVKVRPVLNPPDVHRGSAALRLGAAKGAWTVYVNFQWNQRDVTSYGALSFWIKATGGEPPKELYAQLSDAPEFSDPTTTAAIPISQYISGGGIAGDYRRVVIPLAALLQNSGQFQTSRARCFIISAETDGPVTLFLDGPRVLVSGEVPDSQEKAPVK